VKRLGPVILAILAALVMAVPAAAAPDPDKNKNATYLTLECESGDLLVATIAHNAAVGAQIVGGGTLVILWADIFDNPDLAGEPVFSFGNRGFQNTGLDTETCVNADNPNTPGLFARLEVLVLP